MSGCDTSDDLIERMIFHKNHISTYVEARGKYHPIGKSQAHTRQYFLKKKVEYYYVLL